MTAAAPLTATNLLHVARQVLLEEAAALREVAAALDATPDFERCVQAILKLPGRVVVTGIGKSAHIAGKIVATLPSPGPPALFMPAAAVMSFIQSGDLRALAATTRERSPLAPEVPTFQELGFPGFEVVEHVAMLAPAGTPALILGRLNAACAAALRAPDMQPRLQAMAVAPEAQPLEAWPAYFRAESDKWRDFVRARNIRVQ